MSSASSSPEPSEASGAGSAPKRTILIVEDDPVGLEIMAGAFEARGFRALQARTGAEAMSLLRRAGEGIDWLLADVVLPGQVSGWAVGMEYRLTYPDRPLVYISAYEQDLSFVPSGARFLAKPVSPAAIADLFEELQQELTELWDLKRDSSDPGRQ